jgi:hypothetical protein
MIQYLCVRRYIWMDVRLARARAVVHILFIFALSRFVHPMSILGGSEHSSSEIRHKTQNDDFLENCGNDFD